MMQWVLRLALLIAVATVAQGWVEDFERTENYDRLMVICKNDRMDVYLRKDMERFYLSGDEPECKPTYTNFTEYDGAIIRVKTWSLPLKKGSDGPCGLKYTQFEASPYGEHSTTMFAYDKNRTMKCLWVGMLDKREAQIRIEVMTPRMRELTASRGQHTVEVPKRTTLSAYFSHQMPEEAVLSLHPIRCWVVNDRTKTRQLVVDGGCPVKRDNTTDRTYVTIGSETASEVTGDNPHIFFNAEAALLEDEDPLDLPSFRLQCDVMPCRGLDFFQQVIGVARCPSIARCQTDRTYVGEPDDIFEVNQAFSLTVSTSSSISDEDYRPLGETIYPGEYWLSDTEQREAIRSGKTENCHWVVTLIAIAAVLLAILVTLLLVQHYLQLEFKQRISDFIRRQLQIVRSAEEGAVYPEKRATDPLVEDVSFQPR